MAATMAVMQYSMAVAAGGLKTVNVPIVGSNVRPSLMVRSPVSGRTLIRCQATENESGGSPSGLREAPDSSTKSPSSLRDAVDSATMSPSVLREAVDSSAGVKTRAPSGLPAGIDGSTNSSSGLREAVDSTTKKDITKEDILRNQETNESEKRSVFGAVPSSGSFYPRPEIERRPETGDKSFGSLFAFDGAAPETINGRLAMLGFAWAFLAERATGLTVAEQLFGPRATGFVFFVGVVQLFTYASLVPIVQGESTDARRFGPFTAKAERWNGRLAMIGFGALLIDEMIRMSPVFH